MGRPFALAVLALLALPAQADGAAPLYDPVILNIGINCRWQQACQRRQLDAMGHARLFVARKRPPLARLHLCNRNARRGPARIDWVGFNQCIRNTRLGQPPRRRR